MPAFGSVFTRFGAAVVGLLSGGAASRAVRPVFELVEHEAWNTSPNRLLGATQAAELVATALLDFDDVVDEARRQGYTADRLNALVQLAMRAPTIGEARDMRRRGVISAEQFRHALRKAGVEPAYDEAAFALLEVLPTVTDMVRFAVREAYDPAAVDRLDLDAEFPPAFAADAERVGLSTESARMYWRAHWELPSYEQLAQMRFRGLLTAAEFRDALKAIDYAPTWRGRLEAIARRIPTPTDMVRFAVRDVYDPASVAELGIGAEFPERFADEVAQHGMSREHAEQYWRAHWRLPSARQGYQMVWRGVMGLPELRGLLKALDYPPLWRERLFEIAFIKPGRIDLKRMLRHGILDRDGVEAGYRALGYAPADAELMTQIAEAEVGVDEGAGTFVQRARGQLITRVHTEYVSRQLTRDEAVAALGRAGVPAAQRGSVVDLWTAESDLVRTELTQAQIVKANKKGLLSEAEAIAELVERGMTERDAAIRLQSG